MNKYNGKLALITGGSSGIGLALASSLAKYGAHVVILARDAEKLTKAQEAIKLARASDSQKVITVQADVSKTTEINPLIQQLMQSEGTPDYLFNCAGVARPGLFAEMDPDHYRWMMDINYFGTVNVIKAVIPGMIQRKSGHITNISSIVGFLGMYGYTAYAASKFAVRGMTDSLRTELHPHGIKLSIVYPPDTKTPQLEEETPYKPPVLVATEEGSEVMSAEAVANQILKSVSRNRYVITPGFSSSLYYTLVGLLGWGLVYPVVDFMIADGVRKVARNQAKYTHQYKGDPD
jgi:3-dehydrosphinganine reductase